MNFQKKSQKSLRFRLFFWRTTTIFLFLSCVGIYFFKSPSKSKNDVNQISSILSERGDYNGLEDLRIEIFERIDSLKEELKIMIDNSLKTTDDEIMIEQKKISQVPKKKKKVEKKDSTNGMFINSTEDFNFYVQNPKKITFPNVYVSNAFKEDVYPLYIKKHRKRIGNFGDVLAGYIFEKLTGFEADLVEEWHDMLKETHYFTIGSIAEELTEVSIVWGTGHQLVDKLLDTERIGRKCFLTRGPKTRDLYLRKKNTFQCPEIYGDPGLLMKHLYKPRVRTLYEVCIIPHAGDDSKNIRGRMKYSVYSGHAYLLETRGFTIKNVYKFVDRILRCKKVVTASLHGMIISDVYNIPVIWATPKFDRMGLTDENRNVNSYTVRFYDYFESVKRKFKPKYPMNMLPMLEELRDVEGFVEKYYGEFEGVESWISFDKWDLLDTCPFCLRKKYCRKRALLND